MRRGPYWGWWRKVWGSHYKPKRVCSARGQTTLEARSGDFGLRAFCGYFVLLGIVCRSHTSSCWVLSSTLVSHLLASLQAQEAGVLCTWHKWNETVLRHPKERPRIFKVSSASNYLAFAHHFQTPRSSWDRSTKTTTDNPLQTWSSIRARFQALKNKKMPSFGLIQTPCQLAPSSYRINWPMAKWILTSPRWTNWNT